MKGVWKKSVKDSMGFLPSSDLQSSILNKAGFETVVAFMKESVLSDFQVACARQAASDAMNREFRVMIGGEHHESKVPTVAGNVLEKPVEVTKGMVDDVPKLRTEQTPASNVEVALNQLEDENSVELVCNFGECSPRKGIFKNFLFLYFSGPVWCFQ